MANYGYHDSSSAKINMSLPALDYDKDFALVENGANAVILSNTTGPVDQPETIRYAISDVSNIYKNSDIQPIHRQDGVRGKKVLISVRDTARVTLGSGDTVDYPVKAGITLEYPLSADLTPSDFFEVVSRCAAATQDYLKNTVAGTADSNLMASIVRGALNPQDGIKIV